MTGHRFLPRHHVRLRADFERAYRHGRSVADGKLLVYAVANGLAHPRLGLSVSRKVGGAVLRNRWKRLLREAFRLTQERLPAGVDLVVIPRPTVRPDLESLRSSLVRLATRAAGRLDTSKD